MEFVPEICIAAGMAMLTESRREDGLLLEASIQTNMELVSAEQFANRPLGIVRRKSLAQAIQEMLNRVNLRMSSQSSRAIQSQHVQTLSGGNQQKVVLAKWLLREPKLLILDEPTRGIDVGAKFEIYRLIDQLAAGGAAILVISSEIEELIGICDRILVMCQGRFSDEIDREHFDEQRILRAALHRDSGPQGDSGQADDIEQEASS